MLCPSCKKAVRGLSCECGAIVPPRGLDHFAVVGLPRRYPLERGELEARHREISKQVHPDRHAQGDPQERLLAVQATAALNDAYRTLRDPIKRAEYLLQLEGVTIGEHDKVDQALLLEMLELREELAEADPAQREALFARMREREAGERQKIADGFRRFEDTADRGLLPELKARLIELRYIHRYLEEHHQDEGDLP